jgi:hypothetical protein
MKAKRFIVSILGVAAFAFPTASSAEQTTPDYILSLFLSGGSNFGFRIQFSGQNTISSSCLGSFVYVNASHDNYQAYVSSLTSAYLSHKHVMVVYTNVNGYCRIDEFGVYN